MKMDSRSRVASIVLLASAAAASADVMIPGNMAGAPAWAPGANVTINLANADEGPWDTTPPNGDPTIGIYDPTVWAVVFKFSSVNIPSNVTVTFTNHPSRAPVVWLVDGAVTISGVVSLNGAQGHAWNAVGSFAVPGPGGFRGGRADDPGWATAGGFGPGAGRTGTGCFGGAGGGYGQNGGNATNNPGGGITYGNSGLFPLIGGSGGSGGNVGDNGGGGGAGGGAILIACRTSLALGAGTGRVRADGGAGSSGSPSSCGLSVSPNGGGGSGGGIRLIADAITGSGNVTVNGGTASSNGAPGGIGRVRIETNVPTTISSGGGYQFGIAGAEARLFPDAATPIITDILVGGQMVPADPESRISFPGADVAIPSGGAVEVEVNAVMVPTNSTMQVILLPASGVGTRAITNIPFVSGDEGSSTWRGNVTIPNGISAVQVRAVLP